MNKHLARKIAAEAISDAITEAGWQPPRDWKLPDDEHAAVTYQLCVIDRWLVLYIRRDERGRVSLRGWFARRVRTLLSAHPHHRAQHPERDLQHRVRARSSAAVVCPLRRASRDALEAFGEGIIDAREAHALGQLILGTADQFDRGDAA